MKIKAIIFDLDGTLIDSIPDIADAANQLMRNYNFPVHDISSYTEWIGHGALRLIERAVPGNQSEAFHRELLKEYLEIYNGNCTSKTRLYPGIDKILRYLNEHNISISILTNKPHAITLNVYKYYLSIWKFEFVLGQSDEYPKKPNPAAALDMAAKLNSDPGEILFIGDSDTDIKTAVNAGMVPLGVTWGYGTESSMVHAGATYMMKNVEEVLNYVKSNIQ
jgi:phosphoglycolate phosphatase